MRHFLNKNKITILVTDSGIGGISVANYLFQFFQTNRYYERVDIVYADGRVNKKGYNSYENDQDKIKAFSSRMFQLANAIKPDVIFLACNTLSLILNKTEFYSTNKIPIVDILNCSLNLMIDSLRRNDMLFILGTKTTINLNYYKKSLLQYGYSDKKIINQMCPNLAKYIQASDHTQYFLDTNIQWLTNRIIEKKNNDKIKKFAISFNCTHYLYVINRFKKQFQKNGYSQIEYICPNKNMINSFTNLLEIFNYANTDVHFSFYDYKLSKIQRKKIKAFLNYNKFSVYNI